MSQHKEKLKVIYWFEGALRNKYYEYIVYLKPVTLPDTYESINF